MVWSTDDDADDDDGNDNDGIVITTVPEGEGWAVSERVTETQTKWESSDGQVMEHLPFTLGTYDSLFISLFALEATPARVTRTHTSTRN